MPEITGFNIITASESYAQIAGILAGFAFGALVWLVDRMVEHKGQTVDLTIFTERALVFVALTFLGSTLVAFFFALIAGEANANSNRPSALAFLASSAFALIAPLTVEATVFIVASAGVERLQPLMRRIFFTSLIIGLAFQWVSTLGFIRVLERTQAVMTQRSVLVVLLIPLTTLIIGAGGLVSRREMDRRFRLARPGSFSAFVSVWLVIMVLLAMGFGYVSTLAPDMRFSPGVIGLVNLAWAVLVGWATTFLPGGMTADD